MTHPRPKWPSHTSTHIHVYTVTICLLEIFLCCLPHIKRDVHTHNIHIILKKKMWRYKITASYSARFYRNLQSFEICKHDHDDVVNWKHFPRYRPFVREIHRSLVNYLHKGQWQGALIFSLICASTNGGANYRDAGDLRRHCAHYDVTVISWS